MTYEEAKKNILDMCCWCNDDTDDTDVTDCIYHEEKRTDLCEKCEFYFALKAIEKQIEYRWHDLRKDPFDLPSRTDLYEINYKSTYNNKLYSNIEIYHEQEKEWGTPMGYEVVAWKELETLE